jgi:hypothetical protein
LEARQGNLRKGLDQVEKILDLVEDTTQAEMRTASRDIQALEMSHLDPIDLVVADRTVAHMKRVG